MKFPFRGDWWLRLLALAIAIVIYYALKTDSYDSGSNDDRRNFHY